MEDASTHLKFSQMMCPCGCKQNIIIQGLIDRYETICAILGRVPTITSWNRCPEYSVKVGGSSTDAHTKGEAFDLATRGGRERKEVIEAVVGARFSRYGVGKGGNHIHADISRTLPQDVFFVE